MRVLVIGAGAIGQVFGYHFQRGGAEVSFLVRPKYAEATRRGFVLYPMNRPAGTRETPVHFTGFGVETDQDAAMNADWDLVVMCLSAVALRSGDWLERLAASLGDTALLSFLPGPADADHLHQYVPEAQVAFGMLAVISFQAPLPEQALPEPGCAFWFPPLSKLGFSGETEVVTPLLDALKRGGMPVMRVDDVRNEVAYTGAILDKTILALECADWSFATLRTDPSLLGLAVQAMHESWALAEATHGTRTPFAFRLIGPGGLRFILRIARYVLPFDLERFFDFHYHKVGEQTILQLDCQIAACAEHQVANPAMTALGQRIRTRRGSQPQP